MKLYSYVITYSFIVGYNEIVKNPLDRKEIFKKREIKQTVMLITEKVFCGKDYMPVKLLIDELHDYNNADLRGHPHYKSKTFCIANLKRFRKIIIPGFNSKNFSKTFGEIN